MHVAPEKFGEGKKSKKGFGFLALPKLLRMRRAFFFPTPLIHINSKLVLTNLKGKVLQTSIKYSKRSESCESYCQKRLHATLHFMAVK